MTKSATATPQQPVNLTFYGAHFMFFSDLRKELMVLSNENFSTPYGLYSLKASDLEEQRSIVSLYRFPQDNGQPFAANGTEKFIFASITSGDGRDSRITRIAWWGDTSVLVNAPTGQSFGSIAYDESLGKIFAVIGSNEEPSTIDCYDHLTGRKLYSVAVGGNTIDNLVVDQDTHTLYFFPLEETQVGYFSTENQKPEIKYIEIPGDDLFGNRAAYDHQAKKLYMPVVESNGGTAIQVIDTTTNLPLPTIPIPYLIGGNISLTINPLKNVLYVLDTSIGETSISWIDTQTSMITPLLTDGRAYFCIGLAVENINESEDRLYTIEGGPTENAIVPIKVKYAN